MDEVLSPGRFDQMKERLYILSASLDSDLLNQWQGYAGRRGYSLGIAATDPSLGIVGAAEPTSGLLEAEFYPFWHKVIYRRSDQEEAVRRLFEFVVENDSLLWRSLPDFLSTLLPLIKHPAFEAEREARLVCIRRTRIPEEFRAGPFGVVPFARLGAAENLVVPLDSDGRPNLPLPLTSLTQGPLDEEQRTLVLAATNRLLAAHGYDFKAKASAVPYRVQSETW